LISAGIAVALYPFFARVKRWMGNRNTLAGVLLTLLILVIVPVIIYLFSVKELAPAILWTIPLLVIALSDNVLKPLLMGKGSTVPRLVIFLGAIGGFIFSGLIGLFTRAMVLSVGYTLMVHWISEGQS